MNEKSEFSFRPFLIFFVFISLYGGVIVFVPFVLRPIQETMDDRHLAKFAKEIASADRIVAIQSTLSMHHAPELISLTLTGQDAKRVIQAVSSGRADRQRYSNEYMRAAKFFSGKNVLGEIRIDGGELFMADGRQYRGASFRPNGDGGTGALNDLICTPLEKMVEEAEIKAIESQ